MSVRVTGQEPRAGVQVQQRGGLHLPQAAVAPGPPMPLWRCRPLAKSNLQASHQRGFPHGAS
ncbi:MAG: hypothetical protein MZU95_11010 [Desulfomicrobium escambiense]|nr:hypothetical protein [Desulfomicrobium escambiense]